LGGADLIAFVANNDIWMINVDGTNPHQVTFDGASKNDLQWMADGDTLLFLSGKTIKYYNYKTEVVDTLTSFPSSVSFDAFQLSRDNTKVMIAMSNEIFVVPFDFEKFKTYTKRSDLFAMGEEACILPTSGTKAALAVREARWSADDQLVAWLYSGVGGGTLVAAEQVSVFDITDCQPELIDLKDNFPGTRFNPVGYQSRDLPDFDWDGNDLFFFNTMRRNDGWGEFYMYNWITHKPTLLYPKQVCCYRDARFSPDGTYLVFSFQSIELGQAAPTELYYVPVGELETGANFRPFPLGIDFFRNPKEGTQPALHPVSP
jgi:dipeptidyl aminopeptidase/acylaminoacyl peptidase